MSQPLPHELTGKKSSNQLVVFLHGWPDTTALWDKIIPSFEPDYYILNISYPNNSQKEKNPKGIDFEEMAKRIKATIDQVNDSKRKIVLVSHDWGAMYGYYFDQMYPKYIDEMIALDVAPRFKFWHPFVIFYQLFLVLGFIIGGTIGNKLTYFIVNFAKYRPSWYERINSSWNYSYYYLWKKIIKAKLNVSKAILPGYEPSCPVAFVYGKKNPIKFFNADWLNLLKKNPKNEVHALNCGHWIMKQQSNFVIDLIRRKIRVLQDD